ncbi:ADP-ribosylation factor 6-like [Calliphora vicina]|uniref:ADP-ribosylation factor 6-like n=1 Tax=Calliphora vicina TaxID=7373 RepID=UPI00325B839B
MIQVLSRLFRNSTQEIRVGMLGLDNAGKTTLLYQLIGNLQNQELQPTSGFNLETIRYKQYSLKIWDVGGGNPKNRVLWRHYNEKTTKAIIFVIDGADIQRLPYAANELQWLWWRPELSQAVFLIFVNKQDLGSSSTLKQQEIAELLDLRNVSIYHSWAVQECCALTGEGVWQGLQKLVQMYKERETKSRLYLKKTVDF